MILCKGSQINSAKNELCWFPKVELDKGLELTITYFKKIIY